MLGERFEFFLVARIGSSERLIELTAIREIVPAMELAKPQGVGGGCCGVANVRGEVVPVFDLMHRGARLDASQLIVIAHAQGNKSVGIVVDDVRDIVELRSTTVVSHPAGLGRQLRTANLNGDTLTVLSVGEVIDAA